MFGQSGIGFGLAVTNESDLHDVKNYTRFRMETGSLRCCLNQETSRKSRPLMRQIIDDHLLQPKAVCNKDLTAQKIDQTLPLEVVQDQRRRFAGAANNIR